MTEGNNEPNSKCPRCGEEFHCGCLVGDGMCWCMKLPNVNTKTIPDEYEGCLCPKCLAVYDGDKQAIMDDILKGGKS